MYDEEINWSSSTSSAVDNKENINWICSNSKVDHLLPHEFSLI